MQIPKLQSCHFSQEPQSSSYVLQQGEFAPQQSLPRPDLSHYFLSSSRLVELLQSAAKSEKKDKKLPGVVFDLLQVSLKENAFELFWEEGVENGLLKEKSGPVRFVAMYYPSLSCCGLSAALW